MDVKHVFDRLKTSASYWAKVSNTNFLAVRMKHQALTLLAYEYRMENKCLHNPTNAKTLSEPPCENHAGIHVAGAVLHVGNGMLWQKQNDFPSGGYFPANSQILIWSTKHCNVIVYYIDFSDHDDDTMAQLVELLLHCTRVWVQSWSMVPTVWGLQVLPVTTWLSATSERIRHRQCNRPL